MIDVDGSEEVLSASEFDLLKIFAENPNRPLARDWLLETVGHREMEVVDRAMDLRITRIRRKAGKDPAHPEAIRTARGVGYMFVPPNDCGGGGPTVTSLPSPDFLGRTPHPS